MPITMGVHDWKSSNTDNVENTSEFLKNQDLRSALKSFSSLDIVDPDPAESVLFLQHEAIYMTLPSKRRWAATGEATTCAAVFLVGSGEIFAAHIDGKRNAAEFFMDIGARSSGHIWDLYIVGSYGASKASNDIVSSVIACAQRSPSQFRLTLLCVGEANIRPTMDSSCAPMPAYTGAALDLTTLVLHPASVSREPLDALPRRARLSSDDEDAPKLHWCFDQRTDSYVPVPRPRAWAIDKFFLFAMLTMSDADLLRMTSTSPAVESPTFAPRMRAVARFILDDIGEKGVEGSGAGGGVGKKA